MEPDSNNKPENPKQPYSSPISYEIGELPDYKKDKTKYHIISGPPTNTLIGSSQFTFIGNPDGSSNISLNLFRKDSQFTKNVINDPELISKIEKQLREHIDDSLRLWVQTKNDTPSLYFNRYMDGASHNEKFHEIGSETDHGFEFTLRIDDPSSEKVRRELEMILEIFRIFTTEVFRANNQEPPEEKIIIDDDNLRELNSNFSFTKYFKNIKYEENIINKEHIENPDHLIESLNPIQENIQSENSNLPFISNKPIRIDRDKQREEDAIKKKFGITRDSDLEGLRQSIIVEDRPNVTFEDIAGQETAVQEAKDLAKLLAHPELFDKFGINPPRGILFYGPPGTGKTMIAKALANEANSAFVYVKATDLASKWYGDSEKLAKGVFTIAKEEAAESGHCILFLDEVDSILPPRNSASGTHEVTGRVIGTILQEIDGLNTAEGTITVIASTNIPENVDPAFLSRMSEWVEVPLPDEAGRVKILRNHFQNAAKRAGMITFLDASVNLEEIAGKMGEISGRDIADIVQLVLRKKALDYLENGHEQITQEDVLNAISTSSKSRNLKKEARERVSRIGFRQIENGNE